MASKKNKKEELEKDTVPEVLDGEKKEVAPEEHEEGEEEFDPKKVTSDEGADVDDAYLDGEEEEDELITAKHGEEEDDVDLFGDEEESW